MTNEFIGKTILVTGSGKGLGSSIAIEAGKRGFNVIVHYRSSEEEAKKVFDDVKATGCKCMLIRADIGKQDEVDAMYEQIEKEFGGVDVLVNNAAMQYQLKFDEYSLEQMQRIFEVNLGGYLRMSQKVLPYMQKNKWGRIINISSVHAKRPTNFDPGYSMTKGSIKMLGRELCLEVAKDNITVNAIELGYVDVGVKSGKPKDIFPSDWKENYPPLFEPNHLPAWGRTIMPDDIGPIVMFFASNDAKYITGASIRVDDGATLL